MMDDQCSAYLDDDVRARARAAGIEACVREDDILRVPKARIAGD